MKLKIVIVVMVSLFLASCGSSKKAVQKRPKSITVQQPKIDNKTPKIDVDEEIAQIMEPELRVVIPTPTSTEDYIEKYAPIAIKEMKKYKIPASITLAQGILESGSGRGELAVKSNNHFGIKCHKAWKGSRVYHDDDEAGECFRKYKYITQSYEDHSKFLTSRKRYANLFKLRITDYKGWAHGLKKAGYATDRRYPQKLISIIKRYQLNQYDKQLNTRQGDPKIKIEKSIGNYYEVKKGDTLYSIARKNKTTVAKIKEVNGLKDNSIKPGQYLLLK